MRREESEAFIQRQKLVPDGFRPNGAYANAFRDADGKEWARFSGDLRGPLGFSCLLLERRFGNA